MTNPLGTPETLQLAVRSLQQGEWIEPKKQPSERQHSISGFVENMMGNISNVSQMSELDQAVKTYAVKQRQTQTSPQASVELKDLVDRTHRLFTERLLAEIGRCPLKQLSVYAKQIAQTTSADTCWEILQSCAYQDVSKTLTLLQAFKITDPDLLADLARICSETNGLITAEHIQRFHIEDEEMRAAIAMTCAEHYPEVARYLPLFDLQNEPLLAEIVKMCAEKDIRCLLPLHKIGIQDPERRLEIATYCIHLNAALAAEHFHLFDIKDMPQRVTLACLCAKLDGAATAQFIENFRIRAPKILTLIAQLCAESSAQMARFFKNFKIHDPKTMVEIACLCAHQDARATMRLIAHFRLRKEDDWITVVKECAKTNGSATAEHIDKCNIQSQNALEELATLCAENDGETALFIQQFKLQSADKRAQLAKLCAFRRPSTTAACIAHFQIEEPSILVEIALICSQAAHNEDLISYLKNFKFTDRELINKLTLRCVLQHPEACYYLIGHQPFDESIIEFLETAAHLGMIARHQPEELPLVLLRDQIYPGLLERCRQHPDLFKTLPLTLPDDPLELGKIARIGLACHLFSDEELRTYATPIAEVIKYRNPQIALRLFQALHELTTENKLVPYLQLVTTGGSIASRKSLCMLPIGHWFAEAQIPHTQELIAEFNRAFSGKVLRGFRERSLRQGQPGLEQTWILTTLALDQYTSLSADKKLQLMAAVLRTLDTKNPVQDLFTRLSYMQTLCSIGRGELLAQFTSHLATDSLQQVVNECILADRFLDIKTLKGVALEERYSATLGAMRTPNAWAIYKEKLASLRTQDPSLLESYQTFLQRVLKGTDEHDRYTTETAHSVKIQENFKSTWKRWTQLPHPQEVTLERFSQAISPISTEFLASQFTEDGGLSNAKGKLPMVMHFVINPSSKDRLLGLCAEEPTNPIRQAEAMLLKLSNLLIGDKKAAKEVLEEIISKLSSLKELGIVKNLKQLVRELDAYPTIKESVLVTDTHNWQDLLLCGTEVPNSCLRVDGDPTNNQGLLGYLLDGKIRVLAVKDPESQKIITRCVWRLLWDATHQRPALLIDQIYPEISHPAHLQQLLNLAKEEAVRLDCPLYTMEHQFPSSETSVTLQSLGGPAPEYVDGLRGVQTGPYSIQSPRQISLN